jgi:hypothetical protein
MEINISDSNTTDRTSVHRINDEVLKAVFLVYVSENYKVQSVSGNPDDKEPVLGALRRERPPNVRNYSKVVLAIEKTAGISTCSVSLAPLKTTIKKAP